MRALVKVKLREVQLSKSRPTLPDTVNALAESMREIGLINPVIVKPGVIYDGAIMVQGFRVVAGNHRVSAARALGWDEIDAFVDDGEELKLELAEIDENLLRAELTPAQRAAAVARRKEIWEAMHPETGRRNPPSSLSDGRRAGPQHGKSFATDTMEKTGESDRRTREHLARAQALGPDIHAVVGTSLDKAGELDALKDMEPEDRRELIERAVAGEQVSAKHHSGNDDPAKLKRLVTQAIGEIARLAKAGTPEDVAEAMATQPINPDLKPYIEAIYNAYRARRRAA